MVKRERLPTRLSLLVLMSASLWLAGCDALGIETPGKVAEKKEAEGRAIGSACRHAVRSIEDCYGSNPKASKAAIFAGWRDMDAYMRENDIPGMPSKQDPLPASAGRAPGEEVVTPSGQANANATSGTVALPPRPAVSPASTGR